MDFKYLKTRLSLLVVFSMISCGDDAIDSNDSGETGGGEPEFTGLSYAIVDTAVSDFYNNDAIISAPNAADDFYGQDATYAGNQPSYTDHGNGTVTIMLQA